MVDEWSTQAAGRPRFRRTLPGNLQSVTDERTIRCPSCGMEVAVADAREKSEADELSPLTCPTCGAGFDRDGNLVHEPAVGP
jgi:DNA-directed RNA polymerase subunit RPC12/RpoP